MMNADVHLFKTRNRLWKARVVTEGDRHYTPAVKTIEEVWPWVTAILGE